MANKRRIVKKGERCKGWSIIEDNLGAEIQGPFPASAMPDGEAKRHSKRPDLSQLPLEGLQRIARVFEEGEAIYGRDNWKTGGTRYRYDAANHALDHLFKHVQGDDREDHLAKVGWWVLTEAYHQARDREKEAQP